MIHEGRSLLERLSKNVKAGVTGPSGPRKTLFFWLHGGAVEPEEKS